MGRSSGQRVDIHNNTRFSLRRLQILDVCGESSNHPTEIAPREVLHLQNNGKVDYYGSEIVYTYHITNTPDKDEKRWILRIYSIGAYKLKNACFAAQILWQDPSSDLDPGPADIFGTGSSGASGGSSERLRFWGTVFSKQTGKKMAQVSWRDTTKHHAWNPDPRNDGVDSHCPFTLEITNSQEYPEGGKAFYKIDLAIGYKDRC